MLRIAHGARCQRSPVDDATRRLFGVSVSVSATAWCCSSEQSPLRRARLLEPVATAATVCSQPAV